MCASSAGEIVFEARAHTPLGDAGARELICALNYQQSMEFRAILSGQVAGSGGPLSFAGEVGRFAVRNSHGAPDAGEYEDEARNITVRVGLEGRTLRAWSDESGAWQEVFAFSF